MPNRITSQRVTAVEFIEDPHDAVPSSTRTYDENTLEERIDYILAENPDKAERATEEQRVFIDLCKKIFRGRAGRWSTAQIQVELSRKLVEPITLHDFQ